MPKRAKDGAAGAMAVLVVDDEEVSPEVTRAYLRDLGIDNVTEAADGEEALDLLAKADQRYALALVDVDMPRMDGITFLEKVRSGSRGGVPSNLPIFIVTIHTHDAYRRAAELRQAEGFIEKPVRKANLRNALSSYLDGIAPGALG